jgi:glycosyltransferase involved in cell wall biosynthesis
MARASILTLEPDRGGVPALAKVVYSLLREQGHDPTLIYRASESVPTRSRWAILKYFLTTRPVTSLNKSGMQSLAVTDYPMPPRYQYRLLGLAGKALEAPIAVVVSGSSHVGLPLALTQRPYVMWAATLYESELRGRVAVGDAWAAQLLQQADWQKLEAQERLIYERASLIMGLSPKTTQEIVEHFPQVRAKLRTVLYPIDTKEFQPASGPSEPPYIFLSARIQDPRKNVNLLIKAFARIHQALPNVRLVIAGDTPTPQTAALVAELKLNECVAFAGHVSKPELVRLYQQASLFALPSQQEGLCISMLEALACGVPVVSTRSGGPEGVIEEGLNGRLVPNGAEEELAEAILQMLGQPTELAVMRERCAAFARTNFSKDIIESRLLEAFQTVYPDYFNQPPIQP